jgi:hypothetical protein
MTRWDKVSIVDCHELWSLPSYHGIVPRTKPDYPTVNPDDTNVVCFMVRKTCYDKGVDGDLGTRLTELDTRRMELRSTYYYEPEFYFFSHFVASTVSQYFDAFGRAGCAVARLAVASLPARVRLPVGANLGCLTTGVILPSSLVSRALVRPSARIRKRARSFIALGLA